MRQHPIGTGPFKFVEFKPNEYIKVRKNPDYWKPGRPYLDGIDYTIMREAAPRNLAFFAGKFDAIPLGVTIPTLKDFKEQAPQAICETGVGNVPRTMLINLHKPPFDNIEMRRAMVLSLDRKAFNDIQNEGVPGAIGANMLPAPNGVWGMPPEVLQTLPGYGPDVEKNRAEARKIMEKLGYGPDKRLAIKISTRNFPAWRDPAVILISHLKEIYVDAELDLVDTALWYAKMARKDFTVGHVPIEAGVDDPDQMFYENYYSGAARNYAGYSDPEFDKLIDQQSMEPNPEKRKQIVWQAERKLAEADVPAGDLLPGRSVLPAALAQRVDPHDEQHLQRMALRRRLARQVAKSVKPGEGTGMISDRRIFVAVVLAAALGAVPAKGEKPGGILKSYSIDSPASMSIHEEATVFALRPAMGVFNNLVCTIST